MRPQASVAGQAPKPKEFRFRDFYPYKTTANAVERLERWVAQRSYRRKFFFGKGEVDALFRDLEAVEADPARLASEAVGLIDRCQRLADKHFALDNKKYLYMPQIVAGSAFAAMMHLYQKTDQTDLIRERFGDLIRFSQSAREAYDGPALIDDRNRTNPKAIQNAILLRKDLRTKYMPRALVKEGGGNNISNISVPDALAASSFICPRSVIDGQAVARFFHEMWEIPSLQPLMEFVAYATLGHTCDSAQKTKSGLRPLTVTFNDRMPTKEDSSIGWQLPSEIVVMQSFCYSDETDYLSAQWMKGTLAHEFHHLFVDRYYNNQALPYTPLSRIETWRSGEIFSNMGVRARLKRMLKEVRNLSKDKNIAVTSSRNVDGSVEYQTYVPYGTFSGVINPINDILAGTRYKEIVVRVSQLLAITSKTAGTKPEETKSGSDRESEALKLMRDCGLNECVKFFLEEQTKMRRAVEVLRREFGRFAEVAPTIASTEVFLTIEVAPSTGVEEAKEALETLTEPAGVSANRGIFPAVPTKAVTAPAAAPSPSIAPQSQLESVLRLASPTTDTLKPAADAGRGS